MAITTPAVPLAGERAGAPARHRAGGDHLVGRQADHRTALGRGYSLARSAGRFRRGCLDRRPDSTVRGRKHPGGAEGRKGPSRGPRRHRSATRAEAHDVGVADPRAGDPALGADHEGLRPYNQSGSYCGSRRRPEPAQEDVPGRPTAVYPRVARANHSREGDIAGSVAGEGGFRHAPLLVGALTSVAVQMKKLAA